jgi:glycosyltransferase involved in cell wall biosynthesis
MKVAIVHDYIKEYGGAERVLEALCEIYPDADVYTSIYAPEFLGPHRSRFEKYQIKTTFLNHIPLRHKLISPLRLLSPLAFMSLDLSKYDVVIVSQTGAYFPNIVGSKKQKAIRSASSGQESKKPILICYTHTPPRYLYGYATARNWKKNKLFAGIAHVANHFLRMIDFNASKNVDFFIANSEEISGRIKKFYKRDATVIYPPVDVSSKYKEVNIKDGRSEKSKNAKYLIHNTSYYLTGGRLARAKGIDVIVKAFNKNGLPLKIFGKGFAGFEEELRKTAKNNIEFIGEINDKEKMDLMSGAKAFIFASYDEDFGITPVEAMSVGTPVIAYKSGGVKETVLQSRTGLFYDLNTPEALSEALERFGKLKINPEDCIRQAEKFSSIRFKKAIEKFVNSKIKE